MVSGRADRRLCFGVWPKLCESWTVRWEGGRKERGRERWINGNCIPFWCPNRGGPTGPGAPAVIQATGLSGAGESDDLNERDRQDLPWKCSLWKHNERERINIQYGVNYATAQRRVDTHKLTVRQPCGCAESGPSLSGTVEKESRRGWYSVFPIHPSAKTA